jgi:tetratricopeptide (TPR) repeat protein
MQRVTLCAIVRDEEEMLPECLASVAGAVDRMIVVDTGSRDSTVAVAEAAGAEVVHHRWADDFSAARNAALEHVRDGFVLVLDADERLAPGASEAIRAAVAEDRIDCGRLPMHDANSLDATPDDVLLGDARQGAPLLLERLFRFGPDLRWEGVVHEHVTKWALSGKRIATVDAPIVHYGAVPALRERLGKSSRNLRLLERACRLEPENAVFRTYLGYDLLHAGRADQALVIASEAWALLGRAHASGKPAPDATSTATLWAFLLLQQDRLDEARGALDRARAWSGPHPNLDLLLSVHGERAWLREGVGDPASALLEDAARACRRCLDRAGQAFTSQVLPGATGWSAATRLGTVRLMQSRPGEALQAFDRALAERPVHAEARLGRAEALIFTGKGSEALRELEPLLHPNSPDAWILAAAAGFQHGQLEDVAPLIDQGRKSLDEGALIAEHRRWFLEELEAHIHGRRESA